MRKDKQPGQLRPILLIVDDMPENLKILDGLLKENGYKILTVPNGQMALQVVEKEKPDLILLDILMPDMDGYEVCNRLKQNKSLSGIPIIFISALNDTKDILKGFTAGGVDYITKPFHAEEVNARVATHLKIRWQNQELQRLNAEKDKFFSIIAHDLRNPFGGFLALTDMMADETMDLPGDQQKEMMIEMNTSARNIFGLLNNLLEWSQTQRGGIEYRPQAIGLKNVVIECLNTMNDLAKKKNIEIIVDIYEQQEVFADMYMLQTIIRNLISNAIKFTSNKGMIKISSTINENNFAMISVEDNGIGLAKEMQDILFHVDARTSRPGTDGEPSSGLGLILCKEFVEKNGGKIWVESEEGKGSRFYFTLPVRA